MKDFPSFVLFFITFIGYLSLGPGFPLEHIIDPIRRASIQARDSLKVYGPDLVKNTNMQALDKIKTFATDLVRHTVIRALNSDGDPHTSPFWYGKVIYTAVGLLSIMILCSLLATRLKTLGLNSYVAINMIRVLTVILYLGAICFIISASILISGWDFTTEALRKAAIDLCLVFYLSYKTFMNLFLVERTHQIRAYEVARHKDVLFYIGVAVVLGGFGTIAAFAFMDPVASVSNTDGKCRIGLPLTATLPLLVYNITINFLITGAFCLLSLRHIRQQSSKKIVDVFKSTLPFHSMTVIPTQEIVLLFLLVKSTIGAIAIIIPTIINLAVLFRTHGHELSWLCFTICTIDVTWSTIIVHWLTANPPDLEHKPARHTVMLPNGTVHTQPIFAGSHGQYYEMT